MNQRERILKHLKRKSITQLEAARDLGCMRLSERIRELEAEGMKIKRKRVSVCNRFGEPCRVVRYSLQKVA